MQFFLCWPSSPSSLLLFNYGSLNLNAIYLSWFCFGIPFSMISLWIMLLLLLFWYCIRVYILLMYLGNVVRWPFFVAVHCASSTIALFLRPSLSLYAMRRICCFGIFESWSQGLKWCSFSFRRSCFFLTKCAPKIVSLANTHDAFQLIDNNKYDTSNGSLPTTHAFIVLVCGVLFFVSFWLCCLLEVLFCNFWAGGYHNKSITPLHPIKRCEIFGFLHYRSLPNSHRFPLIETICFTVHLVLGCFTLRFASFVLDTIWIGRTKIAQV